MLSNMKTLRQSKFITFNSIKFVVSGPIIHLLFFSFFQNVKDQILSVSGYLSIVSTLFNRKGKSILFVDNELYTHLDYFFYIILLITTQCVALFS